MRKIFHSAPDVPQCVANRAIEIIERHFSINDVRRASELSEEARVRLLRELQALLEIEAISPTQTEWSSERSRLIQSVWNLVARIFRGQGRSRSS